MDLNGISQLDTFFLCQLVVVGLEPHRNVLHVMLVPTHGEQWHQKLRDKSDKYRNSMNKLFTETAEASEAVAEQNKFQERFTAFRRHMESVARREPVPEKQKIMLTAAGWGMGTPRSVKEYKDFLVEIGPLVTAKATRFTELGARPTALTFAPTALKEMEDLTAKTAKEQADVKVARSEVSANYAEIIWMLKDVDLAAQSVREGAVMDGDKEGRAKADALLALLDECLAQAKVQARAKAAEESVPADLTNPPAPSTPPAG